MTTNYAATITRQGIDITVSVEISDRLQEMIDANADGHEANGTMSVPEELAESVRAIDVAIRELSRPPLIHMDAGEMVGLVDETHGWLPPLERVANPSTAVDSDFRAQEPRPMPEPIAPRDEVLRSGRRALPNTAGRYGPGGVVPLPGHTEHVHVSHPESEVDINSALDRAQNPASYLVRKCGATLGEAVPPVRCSLGEHPADTRHDDGRGTTWAVAR